MADLPADDQRPPDAVVSGPQYSTRIKDLPKDGPTWAALFFWWAVTQEPPVEALLDKFCAPELHATLRVDELRLLFAGRSPTDVPRFPGLDMAYVLFVDAPSEVTVYRTDTPMLAIYVTLLYRNDRWQVIAVGDPVPPEQVEA